MPDAMPEARPPLPAKPSARAKPYHHGNLRSELLVTAEQMLREQGVDKLSLRDLARRAGVSHGAPSRHFQDRQALLEALAAEGYDRLGGELSSAVQGAGPDFEARMHAAGAAYVRFAVGNAALLELMGSGGAGGERGAEAPKVYGRPYLVLRELIQGGHESGKLRAGDPERLQLLVLAMFQGIAALVGAGSVSAAQADELVADAAALFVRSGVE